MTTQEQAIQIANSTVDKANQIWKHLNLPYPSIEFKLIGKTAGKAYIHRNHIVLNPNYLNHYKEEFLNRTVPHEVAHLVCEALYPNAKQGHGPEWKYIMTKLGHKPIRCHSYDITIGIANTKRARKYFTYKCNCKTHQISSIIHNRIQRENKSYSCRKCNSVIELA